jgi:thiol-disulfide isomerase/thioredoxin
MITRRHVLGAMAVLSASAGATPALASTAAQFDARAFEAAQAAGKPILLDVSARWCSVCRSQAIVLQRVTADGRFRRLVRFNVDFDAQKDVLKRFGVQFQSTLIAFKGKDEVGRSTGDTSEAGIEKLLSRATE